MKIIAIIPARGGSKGIPHKNIIKLNKLPLIAYTINAALSSEYITDVVVSSDSQNILNIAESYGAKGIKRPDYLATDESRTEPIIEHVLFHEFKIGNSYKYFALLQPTSPLRNSDDIDNTFDLMFKRGANSAISVVEFGYKPFKCCVFSEDGYMEGLVDNESPFKRRQDLPITYLHNGAVYISDTEIFLKNGTLFNKPCVPYVMTKEKSTDIDTMDDLDIISKILERNKNGRD